MYIAAAEVARVLAGRRVESVAMLLHGSELQLYLCGPGEKVSLQSDAKINIAFNSLTKTFTDDIMYKSVR